MARQEGNHFELLDNLEVHTYIVHLIAGNPVAEAKLQVSHNVGDQMSYWILVPISGQVISCVMVQRLTRQEQQRRMSSKQ